MSDSWPEMFKDWDYFWRFFAGLGAISIFLAVTVFSITEILQHTMLVHNDVEVRNGAVIFHSGNGENKCVLLLPSNQPWTEVPPQCNLDIDGTMKITVTGSINLGIHRLVEAAETGEFRESGWIDADGLDHQTKRSDGPVNQQCAYKDRRMMNLDPNQNVGSVIGYFQRQGDLAPNMFPADRPQGILKIGKEQSLKGKKDQNGTLWLGINDQIITNDPERKKAYSNTECLDPEYMLMKKDGTKFKPTVKDMEDRYDAYVKAGNTYAFFNDNVGEFLVQIETRNKSSW